MSATLLVATETHFARGSDGLVRSTTGVDGYAFWTRYLDVFDRVLVAARTRSVDGEVGGLPVEGRGVEVAALPDYRGPWEYLRKRPKLRSGMKQALTGATALCLRAPGPIAAMAWRFRGTRPCAVEVIGDPIDALARGAVRSSFRSVARRVLSRELRDICRGADVAAYVTEAALQRRYPPGGWSTSYSCAQLDEDAFVDGEAIRRKYAKQAALSGSHTNPWRLVFIGSLAQRYKGLDIAVDALALCCQGDVPMHLTVLGDGAERAALEARAVEKGIRHAIEFRGHVSPQMVRHILDDSHLFVMPSRTEGLPRAMLEAMARGVASVGTAVGGIPELLPSDRLVQRDDAPRLAALMRGLCARPSDLATAAAADLARAMAYRASVLKPRRLECYRRLRAAADRRDLRLQERW